MNATPATIHTLAGPKDRYTKQTAGSENVIHLKYKGLVMTGQKKQSPNHLNKQSKS